MYNIHGTNDTDLYIEQRIMKNHVGTKYKFLECIGNGHMTQYCPVQSLKVTTNPKTHIKCLTVSKI